MSEEIKEVVEEKPVESLLDESKKVVLELRSLIEENKQERAKLERIRAEEILKGRSEAGQVKPIVIESASDYAKRIMGAR